MKYFNSYDLASIKNTYWYHGTEFGSEISQDKLLKYVTVKQSRGLASIKGRIYLTSNLNKGVSYSISRNLKANNMAYTENGLRENSFGYLIGVDGKQFIESKINLDEDTVIHLIWDKTDEWLDELCKEKEPELYKQLDGTIKKGIKLGKAMEKYFTPEQKYYMINKSQLIAYQGELQIDKVWKIDMTQMDKFGNTDKYNYQDNVLKYSQIIYSA